MADDGEAVVKTVVGDTASTESGVVALQQWSFEPRAPFRIPVHRHHVREQHSAVTGKGRLCRGARPQGGGDRRRIMLGLAILWGEAPLDQLLECE